MKFYETHFDEYVKAFDRCDIHSHGSSGPNDDASFPLDAVTSDHIIFYGPPGIGKYTQVLALLRKHSPSDLKYEKKISVSSPADKDFVYVYRISDIHYEIDMSLLGCNSKVLWHEIYSQVVDIISMSTEKKKGFIVCKNFHEVKNDLLHNFYSYMDTLHLVPLLSISFIFITENVSFIPTKILQKCKTVHLARPRLQSYVAVLQPSSSSQREEVEEEEAENPELRLASGSVGVSVCNIQNIKELLSLVNVAKEDDLPSDVFSTICNEIIEEMKQYRNMNMCALRDALYNILIYQLDISECIWYILQTFVENPEWWVPNHDPNARVAKIVDKLFFFFKYYNNNYRPICHIEHLFVEMFVQFYHLTHQDAITLRQTD